MPGVNSLFAGAEWRNGQEKSWAGSGGTSRALEAYLPIVPEVFSYSAMGILV